MPTIRLAFVCLLSLFLAVPVLAQEEPRRMPMLENMRTYDSVSYYVERELQRIIRSDLKPEERQAAVANLFMAVSDKLFQFARTPDEYRQAYDTKFIGLDNLILAGKEENMEENYPRLKAEFKKEFNRWADFSDEMVALLASLDGKESESETRYWNNIPRQIAARAFEAAEKYKVPAEQVVKEWTEHFMAAAYEVSVEKKKELVMMLEVSARLAYGSDPKLYGKTLDDKDFDWESLRGKYVLIKFTDMFAEFLETPRMLKAYEQYREKGLEIVVVYVEPYGDMKEDPVEAVQKHLADKNRSWIILSTELTRRAKQPAHMEFYGIVGGVPHMVLADKEGKVMMTKARGESLQTKLAEIFE